MNRIIPCTGVFALAAFASALAAEPSDCAACEEWNRPQEPFRIHGDTYYVGTKGLSAVLIATQEGHILIDGGLPESAGRIAANIEALGFDLDEIAVILNSHAHADHAGGLAELQQISGAAVMVSAWSAAVLETGRSQPGDPQYEIAMPFEAVAGITILEDGDTVTVGDTVVTAHFTPGHTPGGTSWSWQSCSEEECFDIVYADSLTAVSADDFFFTRNDDYPNAVADFEASFTTVASLPCDILITPHPGFTDLFEAEMRGGANADPNAFVNSDACADYTANAREGLAQRIAREEAELGE